MQKKIIFKSIIFNHFIIEKCQKIPKVPSFGMMPDLARYEYHIVLIPAKSGDNIESKAIL